MAKAAITKKMCSRNMSSRERTSVALSEVAEKLVTKEYRINNMNTIQMTLSPWILSMKFHTPLFSFACPSILKISYGLLELAAAVLVIFKQIETCTARGEQHHIARLRH